jgi:hypothetical protein
MIQSHCLRPHFGHERECIVSVIVEIIASPPKNPTKSVDDFYVL